MRENNTLEEFLMEKHFLNGKKFNYSSYTGQQRALRKLAIKRFGVEKVAEMSDAQIEKEFSKAGLIPMQIAFEDGCDCEMVYLVPIQNLDKFEVLSR